MTTLTDAESAELVAELQRLAERFSNKEQVPESQTLEGRAADRILALETRIRELEEA